MPDRQRQTRFLRLSRGVVMVLAIIVLVPAATRCDDDAGWNAVCDRIAERRDAMRTAVYRIKWRGRGKVTHTELKLDVLYGNPGRVKLTAKGPFGVPVFTAWVADERVTLLMHRDEAVLISSLDSLDRYDESVDNLIWRDLLDALSGGAGLKGCGDAPIEFPDAKTAEFERAGQRYRVRFDGRKTRLKSIERHRLGDDPREIRATARFHRFGDRFPFWETDRVELETVDAFYNWIVIRQRYNLDLDSALFEPKLPPGLARIVPAGEREED